MKKFLSGMLIIVGILMLLPAMAQPSMGLGEPDNKQCEMISALAGDFYHQKQSGKSKEQVKQTQRPDFMNDEFIRITDLAINLAYTFPDGLQESDVEAKVFSGCEQHQK